MPIVRGVRERLSEPFFHTLSRFEGSDAALRWAEKDYKAACATVITGVKIAPQTQAKVVLNKAAYKNFAKQKEPWICPSHPIHDAWMPRWLLLAIIITLTIGAAFWSE